MNILFDTSSFILSLLGLFFLPGIFLLRSVFRTADLSFFEKTVVAFALSVGLIDLLMLLLPRLGLPLVWTTIGGGLVASLAVSWAIARVWRKFHPSSADTLPERETPLSLSRRGGLLFVLLLGTTFLVKMLYLSDASLPTATDLGHHLYWSKIIAVTHNLPSYAKQEIVLDEAGRASLSQPESIADFVIGEHLPMSALALFSRLDFLGAAPVAFLFLLNLLSLLTLLALAWRIALSFDETSPRFAERVLLATFLFLGPLYSLASPQAKFVSGGVVGNLFGNFFIPLILLLFFRSLREGRRDLFTLSVFLSFILAYTHHLSTLVLVFLLFGFLMVFSLFRWPTIDKEIARLAKLLFTPRFFAFSLGLILFIVVVAVPTYLDPSTIDTALGTPTKTTRTGLSFSQATNTVGGMKMALGLAGLVLLLASPWRKTYGGALLLGWSGVLFVMTLFPQYVFLDIPSNRIGSYLIFPLSLAAGLALVLFAARFLPWTPEVSERSSPVPPLASGLALTVLIFAILSNGSFENGQALGDKGKAAEAAQTFSVSRYLAENSRPSDLILKDHNYITADAWMKLFFLRDYGYPLSRGLFSRYSEGGSRRERCTLQMIAVPNTTEGRQCFLDTGVTHVVVNPRYDATQFEKSRDFSRLYASPNINVYQRN